MKDSCFFSCYDKEYKEMGDGCLRSIRKFYPDADILYFESPRMGDSFELRLFCDFHLKKGKELLKEYKRIISVDSDHIMCDKCPELFEDYDMAVVQNNILCGGDQGGIDDKVYINAGLSVCANKDAWDEWIAEYDKRCRNGWMYLQEQNSLNYIYHNSKKKVQLLEYPDRTYGISSMDGYPFLKVIDNELYVPTEDIFTHIVTDKKVRMIHFAGHAWKKDGKIFFGNIKDEQARNLLLSYIKEN
jgi:hypothetical protein